MVIGQTHQNNSIRKLALPPQKSGSKAGSNPKSITLLLLFCSRKVIILLKSTFLTTNRITKKSND